jgi:hypothetical protein
MASRGIVGGLGEELCGGLVCGVPAENSSPGTHYHYAIIILQAFKAWCCTLYWYMACGLVPRVLSQCGRDWVHAGC